ncbi:hypothetical protein L6164_017395 [Bauhinia variegata]|uniref:Uncharacterized protein n=1 Tax=Bauhinia variegata TaxID=167791 RepID=A0ACB9NBA6_BAUVA|nr:hypothetical protein L6164_017395 [Bauhinia variegata]
MHIPTSSALNEARGKFKLNERKCILDLQFSRGCLKIPLVRVDDKTDSSFRNMLAFEHCHNLSDGPDGYIADYVYFMDFLINTGKDVDVLIENGILINGFGDSDAVAQLFNSLTKNIWFDSACQYTDLIGELNAFYYDWWREKWVTLRRDYCNTPWVLLLLVLQLQSYFSR